MTGHYGVCSAWGALIRPHLVQALGQIHEYLYLAVFKYYF